MLKRIIQQDNIRIGARMQNFGNCQNPVFANANNSIGKLHFELTRLIANLRSGRVLFGHQKTMCSSSVTSAERGYFIEILQLKNQVLDMGSFAGAACRKISQRDYRKIETNGFENLTVEEKIAKGSYPTIDNCQREKKDFRQRIDTVFNLAKVISLHDMKGFGT